MKLIAAVIAGAVAAFPLAVLAQGAPPPPQGPPPQGPPPAWAQVQKVRDDAKAAAFNDLGAAHRAQVQSIADQVNAGTLADLHAAAQQIDALLTPDETKAILADRDKMRAEMRARFADAGRGAPPAAGAGTPPGAGPPGGAPPAGGPPGGGPPGGGRMGHRPDDAGSYLLQLAVSPERMRALREQARADASPRPATP